MEHEHQSFESLTRAEQVWPTSEVGSVMGKRSAVRNESGLPVDHSGPGLGRANTFTDSQPKTGGLPANINAQHKSGQGSGDGVPGGGEAAVTSSLDLV